MGFTLRLVKRLAAALSVVQILALVHAFGLVPNIAKAVGATPSAAHDRALESLILRDEPQLQKALDAHDNQRAAGILLRWVAPRIAWSYDSPVNTADVGAGDIYFKWFQHARGGVWCGGAADFFQKTLKLFSVPSVTVNFGTRDIYTHVTVLVPSTATGPGRNYEMFDPTFGARLVWARSGDALPFGMGLELIRDRAADLVRARTVDLSARPLVRSNRPAGSCGDHHVPQCGLEYLATDPRLKPFPPGIVGVLSLYAHGRVYDTAPRIPQWFLPGARRLVAGVPTSNDT